MTYSLKWRVFYWNRVNKENKISLEEKHNYVFFLLWLVYSFLCNGCGAFAIRRWRERCWRESSVNQDAEVRDSLRFEGKWWDKGRAVSVSLPSPPSPIGRREKVNTGHYDRNGPERALVSGGSAAPVVSFHRSPRGQAVSSLSQGRRHQQRGVRVRAYACFRRISLSSLKTDWTDGYYICFYISVQIWFEYR